MAQPHLTPEVLVPRLGEYLVQRGHITEEGLKKALAYQQKKKDRSQHWLLGETLLTPLQKRLDKATPNWPLLKKRKL